MAAPAICSLKPRLVEQDGEQRRRVDHHRSNPINGATLMFNAMMILMGKFYLYSFIKITPSRDVVARIGSDCRQGLDRVSGCRATSRSSSHRAAFKEEIFL
jgi:hypothetical protein